MEQLAEGRSLRQNLTVSRRKVVALVTGTLAASAVPAAGRAAASASAAHGLAPGQTSEAAGLAESRLRVLQLLRDVRRARGAVPRAEAFRRFARASRLQDAAESSFAATPSPSALYRQREPASVLVDVIVRELEAWPPSDGAWMTRFADLEAAIHARVLRA